MKDRGNAITLLFKGGRSASWHQLSPVQRQAYEQEHVDLMLATAQKHQLQRMEGFRLMAPSGDYERFWVIDFPDLAGAEAWIEAEMAPPYGQHGYYEYHLARGALPKYCADWACGEKPTKDSAKELADDPHRIPALDVDCQSVVAALFERTETGNRPVPEAYVKTMERVCKQQGVLRLERFKLIAPQADWQHVWLAEFATMEGAEAWIQAEKGPAHGCFRQRSFALMRKWAPSYFASWVAQ